MIVLVMMILVLVLFSYTLGTPTPDFIRVVMHRADPTLHYIMTLRTTCKHQHSIYHL